VTVIESDRLADVIKSSIINGGAATTEVPLGMFASRVAVLPVRIRSATFIFLET
jgi:hypothetical protein